MLEEQSASVLEHVDIKEEFKTERQGKPFVLYGGLIDAFHRKYHGCSREIETTIEEISFDDDGEPEYCVTSAKVTADDGSYQYIFGGIGDATRKNVSRNIIPHLIRMAETRAKARALRDAVNVSVAAVEELGDHDGQTIPEAEMPSRKEVLLQELRGIAEEKGFTPKQIGKALTHYATLSEDELQTKVYEMYAEDDDGSS